MEYIFFPVAMLFLLCISFQVRSTADKLEATRKELQQLRTTIDDAWGGLQPATVTNEEWERLKEMIRTPHSWNELNCQEGK